MAEDREQDRADERDSAARPVTAAARRERRASARDAAARERGADGLESKTPETARSRRARDARGSSDATEVVKSYGKAATDSKGRATRSRDHKEKRPSVFARLGRFVREVISELRKVIWPTRKQQFTYTLVVLVFVAFIVAFVAGLDLGFAKLVFLVFA